MGQLGLSILGAAVGAVVGFFTPLGPLLGAQIGFGLGSIAGSILFGPDLPTIEGPRQDDLTITSSTLGRPLPIVYGTYRLGGNLIYGKPIKEVRTEEEVEQDKKGGKGSSQTIVSYSYFGTGAVAVCEGPATIIKIWTDNKPLYNKTGDTQSAPLPLDEFAVIVAKKFAGQLDQLKSGTETLRFYSGSETQDPDPVIQADKGIDITPAFRGTCYFVFDELPLENYGNRIPQFSILVTSNPINSFPKQTATTINNGSAEFSILSADGYYYLRDYDTSSIEYVSNTNYISVNTVTMDNISQGDGNIFSAKWQDVNLEGQICGYVNIEAPGHNDYQQAVWDSEGNVLYAGRTINGTSVNPFQGGQQWIGPPGQEVTFTMFGDILSVPIFVIAGTVGAQTVFGQLTDHLSDEAVAAESFYVLNLNAFTGETSSLDQRQSSFTTDGEGNVWCTVGTWNTNEYYLVQMAWPTAVGLQSIPLPSGWTVSDTNSTVGRPLSYEPTTNALFWPGNDGSTNGLNFYDITTGTFDHLIVDIENGDTYSAYRNYSRLPSVDGTFWIQKNLGINQGKESFHIDLINKELIETIDITSVWGLPENSTGHFYDLINNAIIVADRSNRFHWLFLDRVSGGTVTDKIIIDDISERVDFNVATEINSTAMTKVRDGYFIGRTMEGRKVLDQLGKTGFWVPAEIDHQIKYINLGGAIDKAIPEDDLGAHTIGSKPVQKIYEERIDQFDLPMEVVIHYIDPDADYQSGSHSFKRSTEVIDTRRTVNVNTALVMDSDEAIQTVHKFVKTAWSQRIQISTQLTWEHIDISPGSVLQILSDGTTFQVFVLNTSYDGNGLVTLGCLTDKSLAFTSDLSGVDSDIPDNLIPRLGPSFFKVLDIPLVRDKIDGIGTHIVGGSLDGSITTWPGVQIIKAPDLVNFSLSYSFITTAKQVTWGRTTNALGSATPYKFDRNSSVNVRFINGTMTSSTETQVLNGANMLLISSSTGNGWEYLNAANVTIEGDATITLDKFLRGRRNTENSIDGHSEGDIVILMSTNSVVLHSEDSSSIGSPMKFQGVTFGATIGSTQTISSFGGSSFKPYSPYAVNGTFSANIWTFGWTRRTRIGGAWRNSAWKGLPVSQTDSLIEYEIDVYDGSTVVRIITSTASAGGSVITPSTDSATYSEADQNTDFGSPQSTINIVVYQIDTLVGRGEPTTITLTG